jgi:thiol:disulfide interchange protein DsbA
LEPEVRSTILCTAAFAVLLASCSGSEEGPSQAAAPQPEPASAPVETAAALEPASAEPVVATETTTPAPEPESEREDSPAATAPAQQTQADRDVASGTRRYREDTHYTRMQPEQPLVGDGDKIEIVEVFMYSCPACYQFEPYLAAWAADEKAEYADLIRLPAAWDQLAELHARAFYTAEALGKQEEMHGSFFREIHVNSNYLETEDKLREFFGRFDVNAETFDSTFGSFAVHTKVQRAKDLVTRYRVTGTPGIVVQGKYRTSGRQAGSYEDWFGILDELAAVEHAAMN